MASLARAMVDSDSGELFVGCPGVRMNCDRVRHDRALHKGCQSVRDRDRLRQSILEDKGWVIHRIWSTSWFHARAAEIDRLEHVLKATLEEDRRVVRSQRERVATADEIAVEADEAVQGLVEPDEETLEHALGRFWQENISAQLPERETSLLSEPIVGLLAKHRPELKDDWYRAIPIGMRQNINPVEMSSLDDVLDLIAEYV
jgi:hypothetical protein